jgi:hypothetical protein
MIFPGHGPQTPVILLLHYFYVEQSSSGYDPSRYTTQQILDKMKELAAMGRQSPPIWAEYNAVWTPDGCQAVTPLGQRAYHAGGSSGLNDPNGVSFGLGVPYLGPSYNPRGIPGEVHAPFFDRQAGALRPDGAYYPPLSAWMLLESVSWARTQFLNMGWEPAAVLTHAQVNGKKNDIWEAVLPEGAKVADLHQVFTSGGQLAA